MKNGRCVNTGRFFIPLPLGWEPSIPHAVDGAGGPAFPNSVDCTIIGRAPSERKSTVCLSGSQHLGSRISPTRNLARALVVALVAIFGLRACDVSHGSAAPATSPLELPILHVNDHHL